MKEKLSFENALFRLDEIINILNNAEISLNESLELYSESAKLLAYCNKSLSEARLKIEEIYPSTNESEEVSDD